MATFMNFHYTLTSFLYPAVNIVILILLVSSVSQAKYRAALLILSFACIFSLIPQVSNLVLVIQKLMGIKLVESSGAKTIYCIQAIAEYLTFILQSLGVIILVRKIKQDGG